jgi:hypothetical protein
MSSSGMLRRVTLVRTDVSEDYIVFIVRVTRSGEIGYLIATSNRRTLRRNTVLTRATRRYIPDDAILHSHRRENLKSYNLAMVSSLFPHLEVAIGVLSDERTLLVGSMALLLTTVSRGRKKIHCPGIPDDG